MKTLLVSLFCTPLMLFAQIETSPFGYNSKKEYGITYTLPQTVLDVEVQTTKIIFKSGELSRYVERYLKIAHTQKESGVYWTLNKVVPVLKGVPNPKQRYFIKLTDKSVAPLVKLTSEGTIWAINTDVKPIVKNDPDVAPKIAPKTSRESRTYFTEEMLLAGSTAKLAEIVAREIYKIRDSRTLLIRGEAENMPRDNESLKLILSLLDEQERVFTEMFTGKSEQEEVKFTFRILPAKELENTPIFRFSERRGVVELDDLGGYPVFANLVDLHILAEEFDMTKVKSKLDGIVYNIPGKAKLTIFTDRKTLAESEFMLTQFGVVQAFAPTLFEKKSNVKILFFPETGGVDQIVRDYFE